MGMTDDLFEAIDTIVTARLSTLEYDKTISCIVSNISNAAKGIYEVTSQASTFEAFGQPNEYSLNDQVYVIIPENDFDKDKFIAGKVYIKQTPTTTIQSQTIYPFSDIIYNQNYNYVSTNYQNKETLLMINNKISITEIPIIELEEPISGYDVLGIKFSVSADIQKEMASGNYGAYVTFKGYKKNSLSLSQEEALGKQEVFGENKEFSLLADKNMVVPDIYNTLGECNQSGAFDITNYVITQISLNLWQDDNFKDSSGELILPKAIKFNNFGLYFGYFKNSFTDNKKIVLDTLDGLLYSSNYNNKTLKLKYLSYSSDDKLEEYENFPVVVTKTAWKNDDTTTIENNVFSINFNNNKKAETCQYIITSDDNKVFKSNILTFKNSVYLEDENIVNYSNNNNARIERNFKKIIAALKTIDDTIDIELE